MKETFTYEQIHKLLWKLGYSSKDIEKILTNEINNRVKETEYVKPEGK